MQHMMVDVETLGTKPGCAILSIGAVEFNQDGLGQEFYTTISEPLGAIEAGTVKWWLNQSEAARQEVTKAGGVGHGFAISEFHHFYVHCHARYIWCHGATFDEPIIRYAAGVQIEPPWKFWDVRCARTLYMLSGISPNRSSGMHHNARDDAKAQAEAAVLGMNKIGWPK